jgi:hypothetical protein
MSRPFFKGCPGDGTFVRYFSGELGEYEEERFLGHAARCSICRLRLNALSSIQPELRTREKDIPEVPLSSEDEKQFRKMAREQMRLCLPKGRTGFSGTIRAGGLVAAGLVPVVLGYWLFMKIASPEAIVRGRGQVEVRLHQPEGRIKEAPKVFSWSQFTGSDVYSLDLVDSDLKLVFSTNLKGTRLHLQEDIRQKLERRKPYLWTVIAYGDEGQELGSGSVYFEIE